MPSTDFQTEVEPLEGGLVRLGLSGELDLQVAPQLQEEIDRLMTAGHVRILVDLTDVSFVDSTVLGVLLEASKRVGSRKGALVVLCPNPAIRELFALVGHNLLFPVDETYERAIRHLSSPEGRLRRLRRRTS